MLITLFIILLLLACSAFFSGSETSLMALSRPKLHAKAEAGDKFAKLLLSMIEAPERLLSTILLGNNLVNIGASALATGLFLSLFGDSGILIATVVMTFLVLLFSEILPKTAAARNPDAFANIIAWPLRVLIWLFHPATWLLGKISRQILKLLGFNPDASTTMGEDDVRGAVALGLAHGTYDKIAHNMLDSVFDLDDLTVADVMTHRAQIDTIDISLSPEMLLDAVNATPHSRLPVWEDSPDNIIGVLHIKDYYRAHTQNAASVDIKPLLQPAYFIPETTTIDRQLAEFQARRQHVGLVVDEYGDLQGIISLEDILEEIVGDITDEHDHDRRDIVLTPENGALVSGHVSVRDINRQLEWSMPDDSDTVTIAGLVIERAGHLPAVKEIIQLDDTYKCIILARRGQTITRIRITKTN